MILIFVVGTYGVCRHNYWQTFIFESVCTDMSKKIIKINQVQVEMHYPFVKWQTYSIAMVYEAA